MGRVTRREGGRAPESARDGWGEGVRKSQEERAIKRRGEDQKMFFLEKILKEKAWSNEGRFLKASSSLVGGVGIVWPA